MCIRDRTDDGAHIAYQVVGQGPLDLIFIPWWWNHLESQWDDPLISHFLDRLAGFARLNLARGGCSPSTPEAHPQGADTERCPGAPFANREGGGAHTPWTGSVQSIAGRPSKIDQSIEVTIRWASSPTTTGRGLSVVAASTIALATTQGSCRCDRRELGTVSPLHRCTAAPLHRCTERCVGRRRVRSHRGVVEHARPEPARLDQHHLDAECSDLHRRPPSKGLRSLLPSHASRRGTCRRTPPPERAP